jgi:hypothetical protein
MAKEEIAHFVHRNGNWFSDDGSKTPKDASIKFIATVLREGSKRLILIEELQQRLTRERQWLDIESYPKAWFAETLQPNSKSKFRIRHRTQKNSDASLPKAFEAEITFMEGGRFFFSNQDDLVSKKRLRGRFDFFSSFTCDNWPNDETLTFYIRASLSLREESILAAWNKFSKTTLHPLIIQKIERQIRISTENSEQPTNQVTEETRSEIGQTPEIRNESTDPVSAQSSSRKNLLLAITNIREYIRSKITETSIPYLSMAAVFVSLLLVGGFIRDSSLTLTSNSTGSVKMANQISQYVLFIAALVSPFIALSIEALIQKYRKNSINQRMNQLYLQGYFRQARLLKRFIEGIVFAFVVYLGFSLVAWSRITEESHIFLWSDRQTFGLVITMLIGVLSAIFSNSLRELSAENTKVLELTRRKTDEMRYLLNEIHELADRFWSEYENHYKNVGKVFLFRANQFAKADGEEKVSPPINDVIQKIRFYLSDVLGSASQEEEKEITEVRERLESSPYFNRYQWTQQGFVLSPGVPTERTGWTLHFQLSDVLEEERVADYRPQNLLAKLDDLIKSFETDGSRAGSATTKQSIEDVLEVVVRRLVAENDGRFCVADISDHQKRVLTAVRQIHSLVATVPVLSKDEETVKYRKVWGYYPTDERLTILFLQEMMRSSSWMEELTEGEQRNDLEEWLDFQYEKTIQFERQNQHRMNRLDELIQKFELLMSSEGLPSGLFLDDVHLLRILLSAGSDSIIMEKKDSKYKNQRDATMAKILTYASTYYSTLVWSRGSDRALLPSFPSPFSLIQGEEIKSRHATVRIEKLRSAVDRYLRNPGNHDASEDNVRRKIVLEMSNRQGPLVNWIRASRAYARREAFLYQSISEADKYEAGGLIALVPESRELLLRKLFTKEFESLNQLADEFNVFNQINHEEMPVKVRGPRSLKTARKSSYFSGLSNVEESNE